MRFALGVCGAILGVAAGQAPATGRMQAVVQSVEVPAGERLVLKAVGTGVQIYRCDAQELRPRWKLVAPAAKLSVDGVEIGGVEQRVPYSAVYLFYAAAAEAK